MNITYFAQINRRSANTFVVSFIAETTTHEFAIFYITDEEAKEFGKPYNIPAGSKKVVKMNKEQFKKTLEKYGFTFPFRTQVRDLGIVAPEVIQKGANASNVLIRADEVGGYSDEEIAEYKGYYNEAINKYPYLKDAYPGNWAALYAKEYSKSEEYATENNNLKDQQIKANEVYNSIIKELKS